MNAPIPPAPSPTGFYIPSIAIKSAKKIRRALIQGAPGSGKTGLLGKSGALSFPNPFVLDFDHKLPQGIDSIPFWDIEKCLAMGKELGVMPLPSGLPNVRDLFRKWLERDAKKFHPEQTLIIDSWGQLVDTMAPIFKSEVKFSKKTGEPDVQNMWGEVLSYNTHVTLLLKDLPCSLVTLCHEQVARDEDGDLTGKFKPLANGQFGDKIAGFYTDYWRAHMMEEKDAAGKVIDRKYLWQVLGSAQFQAIYDGDVSKLQFYKGDGKNILAQFSSLT